MADEDPTTAAARAAPPSCGSWRGGFIRGATMACQLPHGHPGMHRDGTCEWTTLTATVDAFAPDAKSRWTAPDWLVDDLIDTTPGHHDPQYGEEPDTRAECRRCDWTGTGYERDVRDRAADHVAAAHMPGGLPPGWADDHRREGDRVGDEHGDLRVAIREAISTEWHRRIAEQIADRPDGHIDALTDAVLARLTGEVGRG